MKVNSVLSKEMQTITDAYRAARQRFVRWAVNWAGNDSTEKQDPPDVTEVVKMLDAIGYKVRFIDVSAAEDVKPVFSDSGEKSDGCRVVAICSKSGLRVVLEASGVDCKCPSVEATNYQQNSDTSIILPFSEPTAFVVREVMKHLAQLDIHSDVSSEDGSFLLTSPARASRRDYFGSVEEFMTPRYNNQGSRTPSSEDISTNCFRNGIRSTNSASSETCTSTPFPSALKSSGDHSSIDKKLRAAMENIKDALDCYYAELRNPKVNSGNDEHVFKVPKTKAGSSRILNGEMNGVREEKGITPARRVYTLKKDPFSRPSTPHPVKKQAPRTQTPKSSTSTSSKPEVTPRIKTRSASTVKYPKK